MKEIEIVYTSTHRYFTDLVVIREWDDGSTDTEDHSRMDLTVSVCGAVDSVFLQ